MVLKTIDVGRLACARMKLLPSFACLLMLLAAPAGAQIATNGPLTNAIDVLSLPGETAWGHPALIRGVVTAAEPVTVSRPNWEGRFFVQDATAGVFVEATNRLQPAPGDFVEVKGTTHPGGFAPFVCSAEWTKLGTAPLPPAKPVLIEQLMAGIEDSQRIEIAGVVRSFYVEAPLTIYELASGGFRLRVYTPEPPSTNSAELIGATVRVRGTASTFYSFELRQLITIELHVPFKSDFIVVKRQSQTPFAEPFLPLSALGQYQNGRELGERVHVKGTVTGQRLGEDLFIRDAHSGLHIKTRQDIPLEPGAVIEAVGFPNFNHYLPVLEDATVRQIEEPPEKPEPWQVPIKKLQAGVRHADLIRLTGKVLGREERIQAAGDGGKPLSQTILTLQTDGALFTVEGVSTAPNHALQQIPVGSQIEVDGICFMRIDAEGKREALNILLPAPQNVRVLRKPDWLTPERLLVSVAVLLVVLVVAINWIVMVQKRNRALKVLIQEKVKAQQELQQSHDLLEWRVAERTKQLKVEMTARKEADVQFKATLAERTRLARELHDTLEQNLTGIGLQVDTAARLVGRNPEASERHMGLVRSLMTQTQLELRRSIWDLRSRELEQFDFANALEFSAQKITEDTGLKLKIEITGKPCALSEITEENLLRISQAAITNVIKHARATRVTVQLQFAETELALVISDDGLGFVPEHNPGAAEGHFGLIGMAERAKRMLGDIKVTSQPGSGTRVEIRIPLAPPNTKNSTDPLTPENPHD